MRLPSSLLIEGGTNMSLKTSDNALQGSMGPSVWSSEWTEAEISCLYVSKLLFSLKDKTTRNSLSKKKNL
jgi:hypothetical protein